MTEDTRPLIQADGVSGPAARRRFLRTSGRVAVAAPAVVLLLAASQRNASAQTPYQTPPANPPGVPD